VLRAAIRLLEQHDGTSPTLREIGAALGLSIGGVQRQLDNLRRLGYIGSDGEGLARNLRILKRPDGTPVSQRIEWTIGAANGHREYEDVGASDLDEMPMADVPREEGLLIVELEELGEAVAVDTRRKAGPGEESLYGYPVVRRYRRV